MFSFCVALAVTWVCGVLPRVVELMQSETLWPDCVSHVLLGGLKGFGQGLMFVSLRLLQVRC